MNPTSGLPIVGYVSLSKKRDSEPQFPHLCMEQNNMPSVYLIGWVIGCEMPPHLLFLLFVVIFFHAKLGAPSSMLLQRYIYKSVFP